MKASDFYKDVVSNEEKSRIDKLELFDEYEAWHLKCTHYILLSAVKGEFCDKITQASYNRSGLNISELMENLSLKKDVDLTEPSIVKMEPFEVKFGLRFGHQMCSIGANLFVFGGFGELATDTLGKHLRMSAMEIYNFESKQLSVIDLGNSVIGDRIFHSCATLGTDTIYMNYGRTNPSKLFDSITKIKLNLGVNAEATTSTSLDANQISVENIEIVNKKELNVLPRFRHASCATPDDRLFIHGGKFYDEAANSNVILNDAYVLNHENSLVKINVSFDFLFLSLRIKLEKITWSFIETKRRVAASHTIN
jgi:hypothetical protein